MVEEVVIQAAETGPDAPVEEAVEQPQEAPERPQWLPEKFNSAEDLAKAYAELEAQNTRANQQLAEPNPETLEVPQVQSDVSEPQTSLNFEEMAEEFGRNQSLSSERYDQLERAGIPRDIVDSYIAGQSAVGNQLRSEAESIAGGSESYGDMVNWASQNLSEGEQQQYNTAMQSGNKDAIMMAVRGLHSRYQADFGQAPNLRHGASEYHQGDIYDSWAQVSRDMSSDQYKADPAYRAAVEERLARSGPLAS